MNDARKIASDGELRAIAEAGAGFVADPFNRRWHVATCPRILAMTIGQPKWFAPTRAALDVYLQGRLAQHRTCPADPGLQDLLPERRRARRCWSCLRAAGAKRGSGRSAGSACPAYGERL